MLHSVRHRAAGAYVALEDGAPAEVSGQVFAIFSVNGSGPAGYQNPVVGATVSTPAIPSACPRKRLPK